MKNVLLRAGICVWLERGLPTVGHRKMNEPFEWRFWCSFVMFCACVACVWIACVFVYIVLYMVCGVCVRITFCPLTIVCLCMRWCASMRVSHHVVAHAQTTIFAYNYTWWVQLNGLCVFPEQQTKNITVENSITEFYSAELGKQKMHEMHVCTVGDHIECSQIFLHHFCFLFKFKSIIAHRFAHRWNATCRVSEWWNVTNNRVPLSSTTTADIF